MISPSNVLGLAKAFIGSRDESLGETTERLDVTGVFTPTLYEQWSLILNEGSALGIQVTLVDMLEEPITAKHFHTSQAIEGRIIVRKTHTDTTFYFFTTRGLDSLLNSDELRSRARRILIAEEFAPFQACSISFERWNGTEPDVTDPDPLADVTPRRYVQDIAGRQVPSSIGDALLAREPASSSPPFDHWRSSSIARLRTALASEVWRNEGGEIIALHGSRTVNVVAGERGDSKALFDAANEAATWVYVGVTDVEARHLLFVNELAREWPADATWVQEFAAVAPRALASAQNAYRKHLSETSNETLKSLSDLRKSLNDEIAKVTQQTRDLIAALWRDFAIAISAIVARALLVVTGKAEADSPALLAVMAGTALFVAYSVCVNLYTNWRFGVIAAKNRNDWRDALYGFLAPDDLERLANDPLKDANKVYNRTAWAVAIGYALTIGGIVASVAAYHPVVTNAQGHSPATNVQRSKPNAGASKSAPSAAPPKPSRH
jgi:hypothetical protein